VNIVNQSKAQAIGQPTSLTSVRSKLSCNEPLRAFFAGILVAAGIAAAAAAPAWANADSAADPQSVALENWRAALTENPPQEAGCFRESYPSLVHERVDCYTGPLRAHPVHRTPADDVPFVVGDRNDYVAETSGKTFWAGGNFSDVSVQSEASVGVAQFGGAGNLGPEEYSLQINTNDWGKTTNGCNGGAAGCHVWQQFVYATDSDCNFLGDCTAGVFIQYWLLNYGPCPSNNSWNQSGQDCWINGGNIASAPDFPITDLANVSLHAVAKSGGLDCAEVYDNTGAGWGVCEPDSQLDISSVWDKTEFGIFGDAGGSEAQFGFGTRFNELLQVNDGSGAAPKCLGPSNAGTTGETNNLTLGKCDVLVGKGLYPRITFTESNPFSPPKPPTACGEIQPGQGLIPGHSWHSCDGRFTLAMQTDSNLVLYEAGVAPALWNTSTVGRDAAFVFMQSDGNLVLYNTRESAVWASNTSGYEGGIDGKNAYLAIQNDGNLVIYLGSQVLWTSDTGGH
jgi:hypothetical protein